MSDSPLITIRRMTPEDAQMVAILEAECFSQPWSAQAFADASIHPNYCYLVAFEGEKLAGYAGCTVSYEDADITNIAVAEDYRGMGIASKLLDVLKQNVTKRGVVQIFLEVRESNEHAKRLYEAKGFAYIGRRPHFYQLPDEDALLMKAELTEELC